MTDRVYGIRESDMNKRQLELYSLMSKISEECNYAGWHLGNEHHIWSALCDGDMRYGMGEIDPSHLARCRQLSSELNGWIAWVDDDNQPGLQSTEWGLALFP